MKIQYFVFALCIGQSFANFNFLQILQGLGTKFGNNPVFKAIANILEQKGNSQGQDLGILIHSLNAEDVEFASAFLSLAISNPVYHFDSAVEQYNGLISELENSNGTLFPLIKDAINPIVYKSLTSASKNIKNIQTTFMVCITTFENFLQLCRTGLAGAKTINNNTAFIAKKSIVNGLLKDLKNLIYITQTISQGFANVDKDITAIAPLLALDLPPQDAQLLVTIETLSSNIAQSYHELSIDDAEVVKRMPSIIFDVNSVQDRIELQKVMPDFTGPLIAICKSIYAIGQNSAQVTTDIQSLMSAINAYIIGKQLELPTILNNVLQ